MAKRPTIVDVARACGLATSTVSNALHNKSYVTDKTRALVLETAERLGYRASMTARSLRTQHSCTIGMLVSDITHPFYTDILAGIEEVAWDQDYSVIIGNTEFSSAKQSKYIVSMLDKDVDGLILASHNLSAEDVETLKRYELPIAFLNRYDARFEADYVGVDNLLAIQLGVRHLVEHGHRRIGYVGGDGSTTAAQERLQGFHAALANAGLSADPAIITQGNYTQEAGLRAGEALLATSLRPTAIVCANDLMALGIMTAAMQRGLDIPGDLSIVGFDDIDFAAHPRIALTTVHYPRAESGRIAAELLFDRIEKRKTAFQTVRLGAHLVIRQSVAAPSGRTRRRRSREAARLWTPQRDFTDTSG